jgi:hypothetical protein
MAHLATGSGDLLNEGIQSNRDTNARRVKAEFAVTICKPLLPKQMRRNEIRNGSEPRLHTLSADPHSYKKARAIYKRQACLGQWDAHRAAVLVFPAGVQSWERELDRRDFRCRVGRVAPANPSVRTAISDPAQV